MYIVRSPHAREREREREVGCLVLEEKGERLSILVRLFLGYGKPEMQFFLIRHKRRKERHV